MSNLIQMKPNTRSLVSFWKPSLERYHFFVSYGRWHWFDLDVYRPGKHYVYVGKYLEFTILILKELKNTEDLKNLCRKARRAEEILFYPERIWRLSFDSLLSVGLSHRDAR